MLRSSDSFVGAVPFVYAADSLEHRQIVTTAHVLAVLLQEGNGKAFSAAASSLLHTHYGSDILFFILAAVWARDLLLVEAFLRHIKVQLNSCDEFCGCTSPSVLSNESLNTAPSLGALCLHTSVQLGYPEATLAFLNFGVPVDARLVAVRGPSADGVLAACSSTTALMQIVSSSLPLDTILSIAGMLIARGADKSFLADDAHVAALSQSARESASAVKRMIRNNTSNGKFHSPFVHIVSTVATRDSLTSTQKKACLKRIVCRCRSGLCQLSRSSITPAPCCCLNQSGDSALKSIASHKVAVPSFWENSHISVSKIENCIRKLELNNVQRLSRDNCLVPAGVVQAAHALSEDLDALVVMKSGWTVLDSDEYAVGVLSSGKEWLLDELKIAGLTAMIGGLMDFVDSALGQYGVRIASIWKRLMTRGIRQQRSLKDVRVAVTATLAWRVLLLEENVFEVLRKHALPEHVRGLHRVARGFLCMPCDTLCYFQVIHKIRLYTAFERPIWRAKVTCGDYVGTCSVVLMTAANAAIRHNNQICSNASFVVQLHMIITQLLVATSLDTKVYPTN